MTPHIPLLRAGRPYRSLDVVTLDDITTGETIAEVSRANPGLIGRDFLRAADNQRTLDALKTSDLLAICRRAARAFAEETLPLGDGEQSVDDFIRQLSATTGLPRTLARFNMDKITRVLADMEEIVAGLTRGLDLSVLDGGHVENDGRRLAYQRETTTLGAVLPNNSPGVHGLWLPAIPFKVPLVLKPGQREPWTPWRIAQALIASGLPPQAVSLYPADSSGAIEILRRSGRALFFGGAATVASWRGDPRIQIHGPGLSKVVLGADAAPGWQRHLDLMVGSIADNSGRSCLNASGVWTTSDGDALADGLARRLATIEPLALDDPDARLAAFSDPRIAHAIDDWLEQRLADDDVEDVTARHRSGPRLVEAHGCTYLRPTVVRVRDPQHELARTEMLFPFASVVEVDEPHLLEAIGPTLVGSVLTDDPELRAAALTCPHIDRLNLGAIATHHISWDQPHEGNLFAHLYRQRSLQVA